MLASNCHCGAFVYSDRFVRILLTCSALRLTVFAVGNIVTDLFYSLSPLYYLSNVKVSVYNKWALRGVFMIGLLATVCAVAKCTELPRLGSTTNPTCKYPRFSNSPLRWWGVSHRTS
jgi:hypothetical protein